MPAHRPAGESVTVNAVTSGADQRLEQASKRPVGDARHRVITQGDARPGGNGWRAPRRIPRGRPERPAMGRLVEERLSAGRVPGAEVRIVTARSNTPTISIVISSRSGTPVARPFPSSRLTPRIVTPSVEYDPVASPPPWGMERKRETQRHDHHHLPFWLLATTLAWYRDLTLLRRAVELRHAVFDVERARARAIDGRDEWPRRAASPASRKPRMRWRCWK